MVPKNVIRVSAHAALRYAQRVLELRIDEHALRRDRALRARCERGVCRLFFRALPRSNGDVDVWVTGTRALVVKDGWVLTVLVARNAKGFSKFFLRRFGDPSARAGAPAA
jgi:hypothetical protein